MTLPLVFERFNAAHDSMIANHFGSMVPAYHGGEQRSRRSLHASLNLNFIKKQAMRYGE
ncbi:hypothetical protein [Escherichia coli]|uniref:hypothetical protein n=1 Tax=Escherichia coli TaxID=562 RepID=UPI00388FC82C